ncbi:MAG: helix-turn-helix domain-containing protein [Clostridiales bacterium]|nr:helix-turn-helix domain-containing protein [Clostridiales bacterium]
MDQKKTGRFLKQLRNEKGLTQEQLANKFNVTNRSVSRWETGSNLPDISLLVEIADFYDVDVREIIDGERKSEMMDNEIREVADKMADYSNEGNRKKYLWIQIAGVVGVCFSLASLINQIICYEPKLGRIAAILGSFISLVIMCIITLYVTGLLQKIARHKKLVFTVKIITLVMLAIGAYYMFLGIFVIGVFALNFGLSRKKVYNDPADYNKFIHSEKINSDNSYCSMDEFIVLPEKIDGLDVKEFQLTYYNPWDPQYVVYMTIDYDEASYDTEISRLESLGIDGEYTDYYTVTGEPQGYDLVAMAASDYYGFVYAMVPEGKTDNTEITYCAIWFCNNMLDLDIHDYMPDEYLLPGFDATMDNPYQLQKDEEMGIENPLQF